jgi:hypothetical protein
MMAVLLQPERIDCIINPLGQICPADGLLAPYLLARSDEISFIETAR